MTDKPPRRRFRFGIRALMLLIVIVGLFLGDRVNRAREQREAVAAVKRSSGWVRYADEFVIGPVKVPSGNAIWMPSWGKLTPGKGPNAPRWVRRWLGDEYVREVAHVSLFVDIQKGSAGVPSLDQPVDDVLAKLATQTGVRTLQLGGSSVTDAGLKSVGRITGLEELMIWWASGITDAGVAELARLPRLRNVDIGLSSLTDDGVRHLATLPALESLRLQGQRLTDVSLTHLAKSTRLKSLILTSKQSEIGDDGLAALKDFHDLEALAFEAPKVTDQGLEHLKGLKRLRILRLGNSRVTKEGRAQMLKAIPGLDFSP